MPTLTRLAVGGEARGWERAGFLVTDGEIRLRGVTLEVGPGQERGVVAWGVDGIDAEIDGLAQLPSRPPAPPEGQPNGVSGLDHVVVLTRDLDTTARAFAEAGLVARGQRDVPGRQPPTRQLFYVLDSAVCEVVGPVGAEVAQGSARFWGLAFVTDDLEDTVAALGLLCGPVREAVQPGRRIATLRHRAAGVPVPTVLMSPRR